MATNRGGDPAIRMAIIDGPVDLNHPSLIGARITVSDQDAVSKSVVKSEHGTHVTSVLMGVPGSSVIGLTPNCTATIYSIYREGDNGELIPSSQATLALTINRALADGADVINISSGQLTPTGEAQRILADAVRSCSRAGKLIIAAAGNDGCRCLQVPASLELVLAVGACDLDGQPLPFSNFGDAYLENGILAPGKDVKGASPLKNVALRSGTSFATPIITGVIALLLSVLRMSGRDPDPRVVRMALLESATPCQFGNGTRDQQRCLNGVLNISGAVAALFPDQQTAEGGLAPTQPSRNTPAIGAPLPVGVSNASPIPALQETLGGKAMGEMQTRGSQASSHILGPDGNALRAAAVTPAEAPPAQDAAVAGVAASPASSITAAPAQMSAAPGVMWMPVSMTGSMMPAGLQLVPGAVLPSSAQAGVVPAEALQPSAARNEAAAGLRPNEAGCGCGVRPAQAQGGQLAYLDPVLTTALQGPAGMQHLAFPLGQLYFDFGKEARIDYFVQAIASWRDSLVGRGDQEFGPNRDRAGDTAAPYNPEIMARYFLDLAPGEQASPTPIDVNFRDADALIWTLTIDATPIYVLKPLDVFGLGFYSSLVQALWFQEVSRDPPSKVKTLTRPAEGPAQTIDDFPPRGRITRVSFAGWLDPAATTKLLNGTVLPVLVTDWRGFFQWDLYTLLGDDAAQWPAGAEDFLERLYNEFRNTGVSPQDRALNYSAMNALNTKQIFKKEAEAGRRLDTVEVDRSTICRPDSDCWDVTYRFFDPVAVLTQARQVYQYTIDVSDVVPVPVGRRVRRWAVY